MLNNSDLQKLQELLQPIMGRKAWGVTQGVGSMFFVEFGTPPLGERSRSEWHLWIAHCAWRLERRGEVMIGSESKRSKIREGLKSIEGRIIQSIIITPPALDTIITFDEEIALHLFSVYSAEAESWQLFTSDGNVLSIGSEATWSYSSAFEPKPANPNLKEVTTLPRLGIEFRLTGTGISPDEITNLIGITPIQTWQIGEFIQQTNLRRKYNAWCLSTIPENGLKLVDPVKSLLKILLPKSKIITRICDEHGMKCEMLCSIYIADVMPVINLDQDVISGIAELRATIDINIILT